MPVHKLSLVLLLFALLASSALGGKLGRIRDAAAGSKAAARSSSPASPPPTADAHDEPDPDPAPARPARRSQPRPAAKAKTGGKLSAIVSEVRPTRHAPARPPRPPRGHREPRRRRSARGSAFGLGGHFHFQPACPTPVIEEHHYYAPPPAVVAPYPPPIPAPSSSAFEVAPTPLSTIIDEPVSTPPSVEPVVEACPTEWIDPWYVRFGMDYASDIDDVSRFGFDLLANATGGLGVDTGARLFRERGQDYRDHLWIGDFNIVYELMPTDWLRPRAGIGVNWLADGYGADAGLNLTCGADALFGPVTLAGEFDFGTLGSADLIHWRATAGLMQNEALEWFAGYDHLDVGGVEIRGVVAGLRVRF